MRGAILINGNIEVESDFVRMAREHLLSSRHGDPAVRDSRKVLLVTAAWGQHEYEEGQVKETLREVGVPSRFENGHDTNLQNLGLYHAYTRFFAEEPALAGAWTARQDLIEDARRYYVERNSFYVYTLRRTIAHLRQRSPGVSLGRVMSDVTGQYTHPPGQFDGDRLLEYFLGRDLRDTIRRLVENDDRMVELIADLDQQFVDGTGLHHHGLWRRLREDLEARILSSNSIFIFGGQVGLLIRCVAFFRLREVLMEALRRGTCIYTVSAGSVLLCERMIVYNDFDSDFGPRSEFQLLDRGLGLVRHLQVFPHCMDRIQTDDPDNLCYLAHRFQNRTCVGLNKDSFLLLEAEPELRCTSIGRRDGVYVFDSHGRKRRYDHGERIPLTPVREGETSGR